MTKKQLHQERGDRNDIINAITADILDLERNYVQANRDLQDGDILVMEDKQELTITSAWLVNDCCGEMIMYLTAPCALEAN